MTSRWSDVVVGWFGRRGVKVERPEAAREDERQANDKEADKFPTHGTVTILP
jgi:hypothetical protein